MGKRALSFLAFLLLVFGPTACSFKKQSAQSPQDEIQSPDIKVAQQLSKPDLFEALEKNDIGSLISQLDQFPLKELNESKQGDRTVLDLALKRKSTRLIDYLIGRGIRIANFGMESLDQGSGEIYSPALLAPYLMDYFENIKNGNVSLDGENFSPAACIVFFQSEIAVLNAETRTKLEQELDAQNVQDNFVRSARLIIQSSNCRDSLKSVSEDQWSKWYEDEVYRQAEVGFKSKEVIQFYELMAPQAPMSLAIPFMGGKNKADMRAILFMNPIDEKDWTVFMDDWWPIMLRHMPSRVDVHSIQNISKSNDAPDTKRIYKDYVLTLASSEICTNENLKSFCARIEATGKSNEVSE